MHMPTDKPTCGQPFDEMRDGTVFYCEKPQGHPDDDGTGGHGFIEMVS